MSLAISTTSSARHQPRADVREVVQELRRLNPRMGEAGLSEKLAERIEEDRRLLLDASRVLVRQVLSTAEIVRRRRQDGRTPEERTQRRAVAKAEVTALATKVRTICVLDTVLPGGKLLRFATGAEVAELGAGYARIAAKVPVDCLVGEVLCEREAQELMQATV
jgi:hypothetical protein